MGALRHPAEPAGDDLEIVALRTLVGRELDPLLLEETVEWQRELDWDFGKSADLIRQFTDMRSLEGFALLSRGEVVGYGYSIIEEQKGLVGDVYVRPLWRTGATEARLFRTIMNDLIRSGVRRIESQLLLSSPAMDSALRQDQSVDVRERLLMSFPAASAPPLPAGKAAGRYYIEPWADHHHESAAEVIALAYKGHIDSRINDQYQTWAGARRFIYNIVQFPGCGTFYRPASFVAFDLSARVIAGIVLTSFVGNETGHITQLCVTPAFRATGLGYELLREAVGVLRANGAKRISLTVTAANAEAVRLYERVGFREARRFSAYVWER